MKSQRVREYQRKMRIQSGIQILIVSVIIVLAVLGIRVAVDCFLGEELTSVGKPACKLTEEEINSVSPLLLQTDRRWADAAYGSSDIETSGCAPTCMAMVIVGLTHNGKATPKAVAEYAVKKGYYEEGTGTTWEFITEGGKHWNVQGVEISLNYKSIKEQLDEGHPIICSMRPGDFTDEGHFIVLTQIENRKIRLHDPNSLERSNCQWDYETLEPQIKNLWAFEKN